MCVFAPDVCHKAGPVDIAKYCSGVQKARLRQLAALIKAQSLLPRLLLSVIAFVSSKVHKVK